MLNDKEYAASLFSFTESVAVLFSSSVLSFGVFTNEQLSLAVFWSEETNGSEGIGKSLSLPFSFWPAFEELLKMLSKRRKSLGEGPAEGSATRGGVK